MTFGSDFDAVDDLDQFLSFLEGDDEATAYVQAIARRFTTQRFGLFYDLTYGLDLRGFVSDPIDPTIVQGLIAAECRKDPRTKDAVARINATGETWTVTILVISQPGPSYTLTLSVNDVSVTVLSVE